MKHAPAHRTRGFRRLTTVAALAAVATLGPITPASAGEYTINACASDRANYSTQAFEDFATRGMISPKGGVGKTTSTFLVGNILASHLKLRAIAVDANPGNGTLGRLPAESDRSESSLADLLDQSDRLGTAAELRRYVARLPSGLHMLAAPRDPGRAATLGPDRYGELVALLSCFYETILLDLGTGVTGPLARFAIDRADQAVLVTTPDQLTATLAIHALGQVEPSTVVVVNRAQRRLAPELTAIEECLLRRGLDRPIALPEDRRLATMLDTGAYSLEAVDRHTRLAVKRLGLAVAERLV